MYLCAFAGGVCVYIYIYPSTRLFASLFVSGSCRATEQSPLPRHRATETLPEIFNSVAAVNSTATLESMSHDSERERKKEMGIKDDREDGQMSWKRDRGVDGWRRRKKARINGGAAGER